MTADPTDTSSPLEPSSLDRPWHSLSSEDALDALQSSEEGLAEDACSERREIFGANELPEKKRASLLVLFVRQFKNPLIYVLLVAGSVSFAIQRWNDGLFIFAVLLINSVIGTIQERKAESSAEALKSAVKTVARVLRGGRRKEVDSTDLVPGDIVYLQSGNAVPADIRLLEAKELRVDESLLTGESLPVKKDAGAHLEEGTTLADRRNLIHAGTAVVDGRGRGVVCGVGTHTAVGRIAESLAEESTAPPLVIRLQRFTRNIAVLVLVAIVMLGAGLFLQGESLTQIFFLAIALAVSAIPAGLPVAITVALAIGTERMAKRNVIVRMLPAVEGLGACTLIASDKTGTLTANTLTVKCLQFPDEGAIEVGGEGLEPHGELRRDGERISREGDDRVRRLIETGALCNEAEFEAEDGSYRHLGDAVDVAFLVLSAKRGLSKDELRSEYPEVGGIPFESQQRFAAAFNRHDGRVVAHVKGAAETVAAMCQDVSADAIEEQAGALASRGYRVLALARGEVTEEDAREGRAEVLEGLTFLGLAGLIDPIRSEVPDAIDRCRHAGVRVCMITGDHPSTGLAIGRRLGIADSDDDVVVGGELAKLKDDPESLGKKIAHSGVLARVEPAQKTAIVNAFKESGHFVAVTGDGVNDAPALHAANIGVAMGQGGTDVARGAADLILTDDNFASIVNGVEEGRIAYDNVRKVTWLLVSTGAAEIVLFFLALATGLPLPLDAVQLLWLNLVTNGIQDVAMAFEKGEPGILDRPPRPPDQPIFDRLMIEQTLASGAFMGSVAFGLFYWLFQVEGWSEFDARNALLLLMVLFENVHIFNCRSETRSAFEVPLRGNPILIVTVIAAQTIHIAAMYIPGLNDVLEVEPVDPMTWFLLLLLATSKFLQAELYKRVRGRHLRE